MTRNIKKCYTLTILTKLRLNVENKVITKDKPKAKKKKALSKKAKRLIIILSVVAVLLFITVWAIIGNTYLTVTAFSIESERIPKAFDGFKIAHVSDLHDSEIGEGHKTLIDKIKKSDPDIIAITGDLIDSRNTNVEISLAFVSEAIKIAPCYYVPGNHESRTDEYEDLKAGLISLGVSVLENKSASIYKNGEYINIFGVNDPAFYKKTISKDEKRVMRSLLDAHLTSNGQFTLMLSHRPELFEIYAEYPVDLVLSGHAHGGQFRLPFIGGLYAPEQGAFPKYDAGLFEKDGTSMIVSRGIGNSSFPFRLNNNPELIIIELHSTK